jgi:hypothetical protein
LRLPGSDIAYRRPFADGKTAMEAMRALKRHLCTWTKTADHVLERLASYLQRIAGAGH